LFRTSYLRESLHFCSMYVFSSSRLRPFIPVTDSVHCHPSNASPPTSQSFETPVRRFHIHTSQWLSSARFCNNLVHSDPNIALKSRRTFNRRTPWSVLSSCAVSRIGSRPHSSRALASTGRCRVLKKDWHQPSFHFDLTFGPSVTAKHAGNLFDPCLGP